MKTLAQKILEFQRLKLSIPRNAKAYNYRYATLDSIFEIIQDKLSELGLIVVNEIKDGELRTTIFDAESENTEGLQSSIKINENLKPQEVGSAITYYRRYNLGCMLNLIIEDDDDGAVASKVKVQKKEEKSDSGASKPRFNEPEFKNFEKKKHEFETGEIAVAFIKNHYQISQVMETKVLSLYATE